MNDNYLKNNIGIICRDCSPPPMGLERTGLNPKSLIGAFVKVGVHVEDSVREECGIEREHIWILVTGYENEELIGTVNSQPIAIPYALHDRVAFKLEEVEDIYNEEKP
jgi:hypothetical protein